MDREKKLLRAKGKKLEPVVRIGKSGINENSVKEINKVLEKRRLIKIKLLQSSFKAGEKDKIVNEIVSKTHSVLIESIGNVVVIYRS